MLKNKSLLLLIISVHLTSCSRQKDVSLVLKELYQSGNTSVLKRQVASKSESTVCFKDRFSIPYLKEEISFYEEKEKKLSPIKGQFEHLNFEKIPRAQARYLDKRARALKRFLENEQIAITDCDDLVCVFNRIYDHAEKKSENIDRIEGYAIYLWFLKTGYSLGVSNKIFNQLHSEHGKYECVIDEVTKSPKDCVDYGLDKYLFDKEELYAFWKTSSMISPLMKNIPRLIEIQRIPRKSSIEKKDWLTCGVAYSQGYIVLNDRCLTLWNEAEKGGLYLNLFHEIAHQVDFMWAYQLDLKNVIYQPQPSGVLVSFTDTDLWWKHAGWRMIEEILANGERKFKMESDLTATQFVSSYALTGGPGEHFAETIAHYRVEGEKTLDTVPVYTYDYMKQDIFDNNMFDYQGMVTSYNSKAEKIFHYDIFKIAKECSRKTNQNECISLKIKELQINVLDDLKRNEPDACVLFAKKEYNKVDFFTAFKNENEKMIKGQIQSHFDVLQSEPQYFELYENLVAGLENPYKAMTFFASCPEKEDLESCYSQQIEDYFDRQMKKRSDVLDLLKQKYVSDFLAKFPLDEIKNSTPSAFADFVSLQNPKIYQAAKESWLYCLEKKPNDDDQLRLGSVDFGQGYIVSQFYNCLNDDYALRVNQLFQALDFYGETLTGVDKKYLWPYLSASYLSSLKSIYDEHKEDEKMKINDTLILYSQNQQRLIDVIIHEIKELKFENGLDECRKSFIQNFPFSPYYHLKSELLATEADKVCLMMMKDTKVEEAIHHVSLELEKSLRIEFSSMIENEALIVADKCVAKFPASSTLERLRVKKDRVQCLNEGWDFIVDQALAQLLKSYHYYTLRPETLKLEAKERKSVLQQRVILRKF